MTTTDVWVTEGLVSAACRDLDPTPRTPRGYHTIVPMPRKLIEALLDYLGEDTTCDHAVNICMCNTRQIVFELELALRNRRICARCGGEGFVGEAEKCPGCQSNGSVPAEFEGDLP